MKSLDSKLILLSVFSFILLIRNVIVKLFEYIGMVLINYSDINSQIIADLFEHSNASPRRKEH